MPTPVFGGGAELWAQVLYVLAASGLELQEGALQEVVGRVRLDGRPFRVSPAFVVDLFGVPFGGVGVRKSGKGLLADPVESVANLRLFFERVSGVVPSLRRFDGDVLEGAFGDGDLALVFWRGQKMPLQNAYFSPVAHVGVDAFGFSTWLYSSGRPLVISTALRKPRPREESKVCVLCTLFRCTAPVRDLRVSVFSTPLLPASMGATSLANLLFEDEETSFFRGLPGAAFQPSGVPMPRAGGSENRVERYWREMGCLGGGFDDGVAVRGDDFLGSYDSVFACGLCGRKVAGAKKVVFGNAFLIPPGLGGVAVNGAERVSANSEGHRLPFISALSCGADEWGVCERCYRFSVVSQTVVPAVWTPDFGPRSSLPPLSMAERVCISKCNVFRQRIRLVGSDQKFTRGHCICYPVQNVAPGVASLPRLDFENFIDIEIVGPASNPKLGRLLQPGNPLSIRIDVVMDHLRFLTANHSDYRGISISLPSGDAVRRRLKELVERVEGTLDFDSEEVGSEPFSWQMSVEPAVDSETIRSTTAKIASKIVVQHSDAPINDFNEAFQILRGGWPHLFWRSDCFGSYKKLDDELVRSIAEWHDGRFLEPDLLFWLFNRSVRHANTNQAFRTSSLAAGKLLNGLLEGDGALESLRRIAGGQPHPGDAGVMLRMRQLLRASSKLTPFGEGQRLDTLSKLNAMSSMFGPPSYWVTLSPSACGHRMALRLASMGKSVDLEDLPYFQRLRSIIADPVSAAMFFDRFMELLISHLVMPANPPGIFGDVSQYAYVVEAQPSSGLLHAHMVLWGCASSPVRINERIAIGDFAGLQEILLHINSVVLTEMPRLDAVVDPDAIGNHEPALHGLSPYEDSGPQIDATILRHQVHRCAETCFLRSAGPSGLCRMAMPAPECPVGPCIGVLLPNLPSPVPVASSAVGVSASESVRGGVGEVSAVRVDWLTSAERLRDRPAGAVLVFETKRGAADTRVVGYNRALTWAVGGNTSVSHLGTGSQAQLCYHYACKYLVNSTAQAELFLSLLKEAHKLRMVNEDTKKILNRLSNLASSESMDLIPLTLAAYGLRHGMFRCPRAFRLLFVWKTMFAREAALDGQREPIGHCGDGNLDGDDFYLDFDQTDDRSPTEEGGRFVCWKEGDRQFREVVSQRQDYVFRPDELEGLCLLEFAMMTQLARLSDTEENRGVMLFRPGHPLHGSHGLKFGSVFCVPQLAGGRPPGFPSAGFDGYDSAVQDHVRYWSTLLLPWRAETPFLTPEEFNELIGRWKAGGGVEQRKYQFYVSSRLTLSVKNESKRLMMLRRFSSAEHNSFWTPEMPRASVQVDPFQSGSESDVSKKTKDMLDRLYETPAGFGFCSASPTVFTADDCKTVAAKVASFEPPLPASPTTGEGVANGPILSAELNDEQRCFQQKILEVVVGSRSGLFLGHGPPGCGKSFCIGKMAESFRRCWGHASVVIFAPTGTTAANLDGATTIHSGLCINYGGKSPGEEALSQLKIRLAPARLIVIDEISLVGADLFSTIKSRIDFAKRGVRDGFAVVCFGDFYQIPPVKSISILAAAMDARLKPSPTVRAGGLWWRTVDMTCFETQMRAVDSGQASLVSDLRDPKTNKPIRPSAFKRATREELASSEWDSVRFLCVTNEQRRIINERMAIRFGARNKVPVITWRADVLRPRAPGARKGNDDEDDEAILTNTFVKGALAMVTTNVKVSLGLTNGGAVRLLDLVFGTAAATNAYNSRVSAARAGETIVLDEKPLFVVVEVERPVAGPTLVLGRIVVPLRQESMEKAGMAFRKFPFELSFASTLHKCQGQTLSKVVVCSPPGVQISVEMLLVAATRVRRSGDLLFGELDLEHLRDLERDADIVRYFSGIFVGGRREYDVARPAGGGRSPDAGRSGGRSPLQRGSGRSPRSGGRSPADRVGGRSPVQGVVAEALAGRFESVAIGGPGFPPLPPPASRKRPREDDSGEGASTASRFLGGKRARDGAPDVGRVSANLGPGGISNRGWDCFVAAPLQCIGACLLGDVLRGISGQGPVLGAVRALLSEIDRGNSVFAEPLVNSMERYRQNDEQQDSNEFALFLIQQLLEETNEHRQYAIGELGFPTQRYLDASAALSEIADDFERAVRMDNLGFRSLVKDCLGFVEFCSRACSCGDVSGGHRVSSKIMVYCGDGLGFLGMVGAALSPATVPGYRCEKCGRVGEAVSAVSLCSIPPLLWIDVQQGGAGGLEFPLDLDMDPYLHSPDSPYRYCLSSVSESAFGLPPVRLPDVFLARSARYRLCAVLTHFGGRTADGDSFGHYVADVFVRGCWWRCDDSNVSGIPAPTFGGHVRALLYERNVS